MPEDSSKNDVIRVGGGPAGSTAGYLLSNFGFNVLIIDKSNLLDLFHNFLSSSVLNQGRRSKIIAHPVPVGNFLLRQVFKNVILVGDAAGKRLYLYSYDEDA